MPVEEDDVANLFSMDSAGGETHRMVLRFLLLIFLKSSSPSTNPILVTSLVGDFRKHVVQIVYRVDDIG